MAWASWDWWGADWAEGPKWRPWSSMWKPRGSGERARLFLMTERRRLLGVGGVREIQGPDETGELGHDTGAKQIDEVRLAVAVDDGGPMQVMGYEDGLVEEAGNPGEGGEQVMDTARGGGAG